MLVVVASLAGIIIGLNFKVAVLVPLVLLGAAAYAALSVDQGPGAITLAIVVGAVSIQCGYIIGLTGRNLFVQTLNRLNIMQSKRV